MRISSIILLLLSIIHCASAKVEVAPNWDTLSRDEAHELLLSGNYDPQKISNGGDTALHNAVKKQDLTAVKLALFVGIEPSIANKAGDTALHLAAAKTNLSITEALVQHGAPLHWPNKQGDTPLHIAAEKGNLDFVKYLISQGAPLTVFNSQEQSPYHKALGANKDEVAAYLIEQGYVPDDPNKDMLTAHGYSPSLRKSELIEKAIERDDRRLVERLLVEMNPTTDWYCYNAGLVKAIEKGNLYVVSLLMDHGAKADWNFIKDRPYDHYTTVQDAARTGKGAILAILLTDKEIYLDARDEKGATALHYAVVNGDIYAVQLLIDHGANVNMMSHSEWKRGSIPEDSWTSYDWDAWAGADSALPHRFTKRQEGNVYPVISPLSLALERHPNNVALIELLKSHGAKENYSPSAWDKKLRF
ncbi:MAG: ankyrin repeat domain-containing protein [Verrucomicrobia bacterium]|nr:ankyrin repeat domain-containing protein [Verrucomicrobiota bacterium]MBS0635966.1 ankyrin repeat domain-containing protein [Verrucomicrobiota bacterium]